MSRVAFGIGLRDIEAARDRIAGAVVRTPTVRARSARKRRLIRRLATPRSPSSGESAKAIAGELEDFERQAGCFSR